jgi:hypothetical protein
MVVFATALPDLGNLNLLAMSPAAYPSGPSATRNADGRGSNLCSQWPPNRRWRVVTIEAVVIATRTASAAVSGGWLVVPILTMC